jgi:phosphoglycolate phosphatase-like HAD superfamily hydrolase
MSEQQHNSVSLSESIKTHLSAYPFWTDDARAGLIRDVGEAAERVVEEAYQFARDQEDQWLVCGYLEAWHEVQSRLAARYPDLDASAIEIIATLAAYSWK